MSPTSSQPGFDGSLWYTGQRLPIVIVRVIYAGALSVRSNSLEIEIGDAFMMIGIVSLVLPDMYI